MVCLEIIFAVSDVQTSCSHVESASGSTVILHCLVSDETVTWRRNDDDLIINGQKMTDVDERFAIQSQSANLIISNVTLYDSGKYECKDRGVGEPVLCYHVQISGKPF